MHNSQLLRKNNLNDLDLSTIQSDDSSVRDDISEHDFHDGKSEITNEFQPKTHEFANSISANLAISSEDYFKKYSRVIDYRDDQESSLGLSAIPENNSNDHISVNDFQPSPFLEESKNPNQQSLFSSDDWQRNSIPADLIINSNSQENIQKNISADIQEKSVRISLDAQLTAEGMVSAFKTHTNSNSNGLSDFISSNEVSIPANITAYYPEKTPAIAKLTEVKFDSLNPRRNLMNEFGKN